MKLERLEVRLRPKIPAEQELIQALEAQDGIYGGMNELMRECLRRGYMTLKQKMESLSGAGDEVATLDALAQTFASGEYGYRVVKTYLDARSLAKARAEGHQAASEKSLVAPSAVVPAQEAAESVAESPLPASEEPEPLSVSSEVQQQAVLDTAVAGGAQAVVAPEQPGAKDVGSVPSASLGEGVIKRKVDWSRMRGLAGSGGEGGDS